MITEKEIVEAVLEMRRNGGDRRHFEVKETIDDLPKSLLETVSAFANGQGGMIILGLSEKNGFRPVKEFDADKIYEQLHDFGDRLTPVVRLDISKATFKKHTLVVVQVPDLLNYQKPCFITMRGRYQGSFIRSDEGNHLLTPYEVDRLEESQCQPCYDLEPVERATIEDLDQVALDAIVLHSRRLFPRVFGKLSEETILTQLGVLTKAGDKLCPTLAGLLATGIFPQRYFPRLNVVFTVYPGTTKPGDLKTGRRYLDSKEIIGSIPDMLLETMALVNQRMSTGAVIEGGLRRDVPDYPMIAVREALANALQHRDYSPQGRGTHIQVNMYSDRLEITNPGGLYGSTTVDNLGKSGISSTRNEFLSRLLTYTPFESGYVAEDKGTGFTVIQSSLANALMPSPKIQNSLTFFSLAFEKRRKTPEEFSKRSWKNFDEALIAELHESGSLSVREIVAMSGFSRPTVVKHVKQLVEGGFIEPLEITRSPKQRYRLVRK